MSVRITLSDDELKNLGPEDLSKKVKQAEELQAWENSKKATNVNAEETANVEKPQGFPKSAEDWEQAYRRYYDLPQLPQNATAVKSVDQTPQKAKQTPKVSSLSGDKPTEVATYNYPNSRSLDTLDEIARFYTKREKKQDHQGLVDKYIVTHADGTPIDEGARYFVLRIDDNQRDQNHYDACMFALMEYAARIRSHLPALANDLEHQFVNPWSEKALNNNTQAKTTTSYFNTKPDTGIVISWDSNGNYINNKPGTSTF